MQLALRVVYPLAFDFGEPIACDPLADIQVETITAVLGQPVVVGAIEERFQLDLPFLDERREDVDRCR